MILSKEQETILTNDVLKKKELSDIDSRFCLYLFSEYQRHNSNASTFIPHTTSSKKSREYTQIIKDIRATLRRFHGLFQTSTTQSDMQVIFEMLDSSKKKLDLDEIARQLLSIHESTKERLLIYKQLYHDIFAITKMPSSILDLGCGLNPASIVYMHLLEQNMPFKYNAYDINKNERKLLTAFFEQAHALNTHFIGKAEYLNLLNLQEVATLPSADICFLFKVTDILDQGKGHKKTEQLLEAIQVQRVVLSFPTKTMSGKHMRAPKRNWVKLLCKRKNYTFDILEYPNELMYVITK
jgi:hypothetical protein